MANHIHNGGAPTWANDPDDGPFNGVGVRMTRDMAGTAAAPWRGDVYTADQRVAAYDMTEQLRHDSLRYRELHNIPLERDWGAWFVSGEKGRGKSAYAATHAHGPYARGYMVLHNASFLFGRRVSNEEIVLLGESELENFWLFVDELHSLVERMGSNAWSNRLFRNSGALMRKDAIRALYSSAEESEVGYAALRQCSWFKYPGYYAPGAMKMVRGRRVFIPRGKRRGRPKFPPFCYLRATRLGPYPIASKRLIDSYLPEHLKRVARLDNDGLLDPVVVQEATKLLDTWEKPAIAAAMDLSAAAIRQHRADQADQAEALAFEAQRGPDVWECLQEALDQGHLKADGKKSVAVEHVLVAASQAGYMGGLDELKLILRGEDLLTTQNRVPAPPLRERIGGGV